MVLYNFEGQPAVAKRSSFADVAAGEWYDNAVAWAEQNKIVNGVTEELFCPTTNITREQMAAILYRYSAYKGFDVAARADISAFRDAWQISDYAVECMQWANARGYINGIPADSRMAKEFFLKSSYLTPEIKDFVLKLKADAEAKGQTTSEAALRWILEQKGVTSVLIGASSTAQLEANLKCMK